MTCFRRARSACKAGPDAEAATGSRAESACVDEALLVAKPANLTFVQAAAVPVATMTALQALRDAGNCVQARRSWSTEPTG